MSIVSSLVGNFSDTAKNLADHGSAVVIITAMAGWLPALAALASIIWYAVRFFDYLERRKLRKILISQGKIEEALQVKVNRDA